MKTSSVNKVARRNNIWELSETKARFKGTDFFGQTKSRRLSTIREIEFYTMLEKN